MAVNEGIIFMAGIGQTIDYVTKKTEEKLVCIVANRRTLIKEKCRNTKELEPGKDIQAFVCYKDRENHADRPFGNAHNTLPAWKGGLGCLYGFEDHILHFIVN